MSDGNRHADETGIPEKTSAWTDADREADKPTIPDIPLWVTTFAPGTTFTHEGWECVVRHVGCEEGHWLLLVEPLTFTPPRSVQRSVYRRLVSQVGKKKAREMVKKAEREVNSVQKG